MNIDKHSKEVQFELKRFIESEFKQLTRAYAEINNTNLNSVVHFSPDLRIVAVDLENVSYTPFFQNISILRVLESAIDFIADKHPLSAQGFNLVERAEVEANSLNKLGRFHKDNTQLAYHTTQAFIFSTSERNLKKLLSNFQNKLELSKAEPDYIENINFTHKAEPHNSKPGINFLSSSIENQYKLHDENIFERSRASKQMKGCVATLSKTPVKFSNQINMGVTIDLRNNKSGRSAILHIPYQFIDEYALQPSARIKEDNFSTSSFLYCDWFINGDKAVSPLQKAAFNTTPKQIEDYIASLIHNSVEVLSVKIHSFKFNIPTSNYAPITEVAFIALLPNHYSLFENVLIQVNQSGEVKLSNSHGLNIHPNNTVVPFINHLKANAQELFQSNRLYNFEQIRYFRKKIGGLNNGLILKNEYIYLP